VVTEPAEAAPQPFAAIDQTDLAEQLHQAVRPGRSGQTPTHMARLDLGQQARDTFGSVALGSGHLVEYQHVEGLQAGQFVEPFVVDEVQVRVA